MNKNIVNMVLEAELYPFNYYYSYYKRCENILMGKEHDNIIDKLNKSSVGSSVLSILSDKSLLIKAIQNTMNKINQDVSANEATIYAYLTELQQELEKVNMYFKYMNFAMLCSKKFIENNNSRFLLTLINASGHQNFVEHEKKVIAKAQKDLESLNDTNFRTLSIANLESFIKELNLFNIKLDIFYNLLDIKTEDNDSPLKLSSVLNKYYGAIKNEEISKTGIVIDTDIYLDSQIQSLDAKNAANPQLKVINIYKFENIIEFLNLSFISMINEEVILKKCKHCNQYFIPENRTDELYCNRVISQNKTCKEYGAKATYKEQMNERPVDKEHVRTVQALRMRHKRKPNKETKKSLDDYMKNYKIKKENFKHGTISEKEIIEWIKLQK